MIVNISKQDNLILKYAIKLITRILIKYFKKDRVLGKSDIIAGGRIYYYKDRLSFEITSNRINGERYELKSIEIKDDELFVKLPIDLIINLVCEFMDVKERVLLSKTNNIHVSNTRKLIILLARDERHSNISIASKLKVTESYCSQLYHHKLDDIDMLYKELTKKIY
jgi:hypothetical protein